MRNERVEAVRRSRFKKAAQLAVAVSALSACTTLAPPITHPTDAIAHVKAPPAKTLDAVLDFFSRRPYSIDSVDRSAGVVEITVPPSRYQDNCYESEVALQMAQNDWLPIYEPHYGDQLLLNHGNAVTALTEFTVRVTGDSTRSTVQLAAKWYGVDGKLLKCQLGHYWAGGFEDAIRGRAEARAPFWHKAKP